jgi:hypothetical protein
MLRPFSELAGFAAPAYFWNEGLYRLLAARGYRHVSSFGFDCDNLPHHPLIAGQVSPLVEIAYHSLGDLFPKFGEALVGPLAERFFRRLINQRIEAGEFAGVYGHPDMAGRLGEAPGLVHAILSAGRQRSDVWACHLGELAAWWLRRDTTAVMATWEPDRRRLHTVSSDGADCYLRIVDAEGGWRCAPIVGGNQTTDIDVFEERPPLRERHSDDVGVMLHRNPRRSLRSRVSGVRRNIRRSWQKYAQLYLE